MRRINLFAAVAVLALVGTGCDSKLTVGPKDEQLIGGAIVVGGAAATLAARGFNRQFGAAQQLGGLGRVVSAHDLHSADGEGRVDVEARDSKRLLQRLAQQVGTGRF